MRSPPMPCPAGRRRSALLLAMIVGSGFLAGSPARGQPPGAPGQFKPLEKDDQVGQLVQVGPGMLQLRLPKGGNLWTAMPAPNARIEVTGKATRAMLQPKQFVTCAVSLDEFGKVTEPALKVVFPDGGAAGVVAGGLGVAEAGAKRVPGKRPAGTYLVAGTIKQVDGDIVTVLAGRERFEITVPAEADLVVQSANVGLASPGDNVEVEGKYYQKGQLLVSSLKIELSKPVEPPPTKGNARRPQ